MFVKNIEQGSLDLSVRPPLYRTGDATTPPRHDLALVELEQEVAMVPACLPTPGTRLEGRWGTVGRGTEGS